MIFLGLVTPLLLLACHGSLSMQGNYVPMDDYSVDAQTPEYDVILALSLSKWIHLNWGDTGIKRFFKKVYRHLRPGGKFILEPQPFNSYSKKKKLTVSSTWSMLKILC